MKLKSGVCLLLALVPLCGQPAPAQKTLLAEDVFKNVQVLKGIPVNQFMETMGFFSAALGYNCTNCHGNEVIGNWDRYADDIPVKQTARRMIQVVNTINK
ncbi:MAG TPA: photosynthetic reaction center cytochrome c subunit family protein, partial [Bryobacteraceae bacterium]|nr:photosynthetic reaction center cytochrome c subunit family protein [Bryobacteraceae bacterium]